MYRRPIPFYRQPRFLWSLGVLALFVLLLGLYVDDLVAFYEPFRRIMLDPTAGLVLGPDFWDAVLSFAFALVIPLVVRELFYRLVSQFVLPVNLPEERRQAMEHFLRYSSGLPGPLVLVQDGKLVVDPTRGGTTHHAGVAWVNSASCLVLRTDTAFTRVRGPGVTFLRGGERLTDEGTLDLRLQTRTAEAVHALTRDGIDVTVDIVVQFILDSGEPQPLRDWVDDESPPYGFSPRNASAAVYGQPYRDRTRGLWAELPPLVAADVFREELMARDFEALFSATDTGLPLLAAVQYQVEKRLTGLLAEAPAREQQLLAERGLRVLSVRFANLQLPEEVRKKRLANWREDWKSRAGELAAEKDPEVRQIRQQGQDAGRALVLGALTNPIIEQLAAGRRPGRREVALALTQAVRHLAQEPAVQGAANLPELKRLLDDLVIWVRGWREQP